MKTKALTLTVILILVLAVTATLVGAMSVTQPSPAKSSPVADQAPVAGEDKAPQDANTPEIYLVRLADAPVAAYDGSIDNLAATSVEGKGKLDVNSPAAVAYRNYLAAKQDVTLQQMEQKFNRSLEVPYRYYNGNNGFAVYLTAAEAEQVEQMNGVIFVQKDFERELQTDNGPAWIGAPGLWDGTQTGGAPGTKGEGIIIGVIDTGINPSNPSFADVGMDGYDHTNPWGAGTYVGVCNPTDPTYDATFPCNDKLIGARGYATVNGGDPTDGDGHGSHTASTSGGNHVYTATVQAPTMTVTRSISGVAPHANIVAYAACCTGSALTAAIDDAIADGVDVINYSIGSSSPSDVWNDFDTVGYLNARTAGIFVATSAGNAGPGPNTVGSPADAPWLTAVGASTHDRKFLNVLTNMSGGDTAPPADLEGKSITVGYGPAPIVYAGDFGDAQCLTDFPAGTWTNGEIVVCDRGQIARVDKGAHVLAGGAGGFVLANVDAQGEGINADGHYLPAVHIGDAAGDILRTWLASGTGHTATIAGTTMDVDPANGDIMASFSSRGANRALPDIIVPSIVAPGVDIIAAYGTGDAVEWNSISGTSMASPHIAGAAALIMALHPDWTPAEVQSALMTTSWTNVLDTDGVTPANPFDMGAGRVDLNVAAQAGLVLDETEANYLAANPENGGDPKTLNLASMGNASCVSNCSWTRTVRSTLAAVQEWTILTDAPMSMTLSVTPTTFTIPAGGTQTFTVTAANNGAPLNVWNFGSITITPTTTTMAPEPLTSAPQVGPVTAAQAELMQNAMQQYEAGEISAAEYKEAVGGLELSSSSLPHVSTLLAPILGTEDFESGVFPPSGWMTATTGDAGDPGWITTTARSYSPNHSAYHNDDDLTSSAISWLVMPTVTLTTNNSLVFWQNQNFDTWYDYHGIWISTGSCNPADGAFVEVVEMGAGTENTWEEERVDLSAYAGQDVCLAFRYEGDYADEWYVDDVAVIEAQPNLSGSTKDAPVMLSVNDPLTYTVVISNSGNYTAAAASLNDPLPANVTYASGPTCSGGSCGYNAGGQVITWTGSLVQNESVTVTFTVVPTVTGRITNTAVISDSGIAVPVTVTAATQVVETAYLVESFEDAFPPAGWTITHTGLVTATWHRNDYYPTPNMTAYGSGYSAAARPATSGNTIAWDTALQSPPVALSSTQTIQLVYASNFQDFAGNGEMWLDISADGGATWSNLRYQDDDDPSGGTLETEDLTPYAGQTVILRWRYKADVGDAWFWQIDEVQVIGSVASFVPPAHMPVAVKPGSSTLPDLITIVTDQYSGTQTISNIQVLDTITNFSSVISGLTVADMHVEYLDEDPSNGDPFDNLDNVFWMTIDVPANTPRLVAEVVKSTAPDLDLYMGTGDTPSGATTACVSASGTALEYCNVDDPAAGTWWVLVQSWEGSANQPDRFMLATAVVGSADAGNMTLTAPANIPSGTPFALDVNWNESSMVGLDRWYGVFAIGTDSANPDNVGSVKVDLQFLGSRTTKMAPPTAATGDTFRYELALDNSNLVTGTAMMTDVLPAGVSYVAGTVTTTFGAAWYSATTNAIYWTNSSAPIARAATPSTATSGRNVVLSLDSVAADQPAADAMAPEAATGAAVELALDDGTAENNIGIGGTWEFIFVNRFTPSPDIFPFSLNEVQVNFSGGTSNVAPGDDIIIAIYKDDDGDPSNGADMMSSFTATVQAVDAWNTYSLSTPVNFGTATDVLIGVVAMETPGSAYFPAALDTTSSQGRSWAGWWTTSPPPDPPTLPPDDQWGTIDSFGFAGNWLVRGYGESEVPDTVIVSFDVTVTAAAGSVITNTMAVDHNGVSLGDTAVTIVPMWDTYLPVIMTP